MKVRFVFLFLFFVMNVQCKSFIDKTYEVITKGIHMPVLWFDDFFSDSRTFDEKPASSELRVINEFNFEEGKKYTFKTYFHFSIRMPKAVKRLKLIIEREERPSQEQTETTITSQEENINRSKFGLRYSIFYSVISYLNFSFGAKTGFPPKVYFRTKYRLNIPLSKKFLTRFTGRILWFEDTGFEEKIDLDFEKIISRRSMIRFGNVFLFDLPKNFFKLDTSITYRHQISKKIAFSYSIGMWGEKEDRFSDLGYRINMRIRSSFFRNWFFWEISPAVIWNRYDDFFKKIYMTTFRLEIRFG